MKIAAVLQRILPPLWLGMLLAIAVEARLKFQAPNITRELGLGIGKLVFIFLNRAEIIISVILLASFILAVSTKKARIIFGAILLILFIQAFWLMPKLIERVDLITNGQTPADSSEHIFYIILEITKMVLLLILSVSINWHTEK